MPKRKENYRESLGGCEHKVDQTYKDEQKRARSIYQPRRLGLRPRRDRKEHEKVGGAATLRQRSNSKNKRTNSKKLKEETKRSKEEIKYDVGSCISLQIIKSRVVAINLIYSLALLFQSCQFYSG